MIFFLERKTWRYIARERETWRKETNHGGGTEAMWGSEARSEFFPSREKAGALEGRHGGALGSLIPWSLKG